MVSYGEQMKAWRCHLSYSCESVRAPVRNFVLCWCCWWIRTCLLLLMHFSSHSLSLPAGGNGQHPYGGIPSQQAGQLHQPDPGCSWARGGREWGWSSEGRCHGMYLLFLSGNCLFHFRGTCSRKANLVSFLSFKGHRSIENTEDLHWHRNLGIFWI